MAKQLITIGTPGAGGGDPAHAAFKKINDNATELYNAAIPDTEGKKTQARANLGLGTAATRNVGTSNGHVLEVGEFNIGSGNMFAQAGNGLADVAGFRTYATSITGIGSVLVGVTIPWASSGLGRNVHAIACSGGASNPAWYTLSWGSGTVAAAYKIRTEANTTIDSNGFIKAASPVVQLYADNIHLNEEAQLQDITFEKLGVGDYLIKGSLGFAQESWYIEMPKDANGNVLVAVAYEQLENNDISVKTYAKKFDDETGDIVANLTKPRDIPAGRWIDLRLQELPQPEIEIP